MKEGSKDFVTIRLAGQLLGIPVLLVQDVIRLQNMTRVPLAPPWVAGVLNLRGRIVTAIALRERLGMTRRGVGEKAAMSVVVDFKGESYSLIIDSVGEVLSLPDALFEKNPVTLDQRWREVSDGIYRLDDELLVVLDVRRVLDLDPAAAAAA